MYDLLSGMRVIESSAFIAAPSGGMTLAQLGADVIRVDPIDGAIDSRRWPLAHGDGASLYWAGLNKGKRSLAINLREPAARELLAELITTPGADGGLFLTNLPQRGELAYETLAARRSDLVMLSVTGSPDGRTAVDYTVNAAVGIPYTTGDARPDRPVNSALPAWDLVTGANAALGLLAAERHRTRTGRGQHVRLALSDIAMWSVAALGHIAEAELDGSERQPDVREGDPARHRALADTGLALRLRRPRPPARGAGASAGRTHGRSAGRGARPGLEGDWPAA